MSATRESVAVQEKGVHTENPKCTYFPCYRAPSNEGKIESFSDKVYHQISRFWLDSCFTRPYGKTCSCQNRYQTARLGTIYRIKRIKILFLSKLNNSGQTNNKIDGSHTMKFSLAYDIISHLKHLRQNSRRIFFGVGLLAKVEVYLFLQAASFLFMPVSFSKRKNKPIEWLFKPSIYTVC